MSDLCPVAVAQDSSEEEYQPETAVESHLLLLKQKKYSDVTFTFPNLPARIDAHEFCLKARSPVFAKIFRMRKSGNVQGREIEITETTPERFQQFLEFIYADKFEMDIAGALDLLQLSQKFKVRPLTKKCEELLKTDIPIVDSVKVFETARRYGCRELMDRAGQIMVSFTGHKANFKEPECAACERSGVSRTFGMLMKLDAFTTAEEETLAYLLQSDDLCVKEVELFEMVLSWGKKQVGNSAEGGILKNKLQNLISKIRYTNMAPDEFTKVVGPTGLLSAEETVSVYSYLCADEVTRRGLKTEFNITRRKMENIKAATTNVNFGTVAARQAGRRPLWFPAFRTHSFSFNADRTQALGKVEPDYSHWKTVITGINFFWPYVHPHYAKHHVDNFNVSIVEYSGPTKEVNFRVRFQKELLNCQRGHSKVSMEPPVELVNGRNYSVIVEDHSTSDVMEFFRKDSQAYFILSFRNRNTHENIDLEDVSLTLKDIHSKTDFYAQEAWDGSTELALIEDIEIGLM